MPLQKQSQKQATDCDMENDSLGKDTVKEEDKDTTISQGSSETLQHCDIVHIVGDIIHVRRHLSLFPTDHK